jgi:hypothetical protein
MSSQPSEDTHDLPNEGVVISLLSKLADDIKSPLVFALFITMFATTIWLAYDHVSKADFRSLQTQLQGVQYTLQHDHIDNRINYVQDKLFDLTERIAEDKSSNSQAQRLYSERIDELKRQAESLNHDMSLLERQQR